MDSPGESVGRATARAATTNEDRLDHTRETTGKAGCPGQPGQPGQVLYCRVPGLLAGVARRVRSSQETPAPLAVSEGRLVRDACPLALARGVHVGASVIQARRLCPVLLVVPLESVDHQTESHAFLDTLADLSPVVEPVEPDTAFADLDGLTKSEAEAAVRSLHRRLQGALPDLALPPLIGAGPSRLSARALAECGLTPGQLAHASVCWLWPEDPAVAARLLRLGLATFGDVAAIGESALVFQFGKSGRLLFRRAAFGQDFVPVRALYPPPGADARADFSEFPLDDRQRLNAALERLAARTAHKLRAPSRYGRRVALRITTEPGEERRATWVLPAPVQAEADILRAARRLLNQIAPAAPVLALRLLVEDLEAPTAAITPDLFGGKRDGDKAALAALRRSLSARFGPHILLRGAERPRSARDERRALAGERQKQHGQQQQVRR